MSQHRELLLHCAMLGLTKFFSYKFAIALLALSVVSLFYSKRFSISHAGQDAFGVVPIRSISNDSLANETLGVRPFASILARY